MGHTLYNEVTAVTGIGYHANRVLGKLESPELNLPYSLEDIKISHNDFAVTEVYNDSIRKLYRNYLYLIANAEIVTASSPTEAVGTYINVDQNFTATFVDTALNPASGNSLSSMHADIETHITKKIDSNHFVYFTYSSGDSVVVESTTAFGTIKSVLSGNFVEFSPDNKDGVTPSNAFKFKQVVSVDIVDEYLFVLDRGNLTLFKFDISGLLTNDAAVQRLGADDKTNPGRLLLKTLGGTQYTQVKNRLVDPIGVSVYDKKLYILDNGTRSIKIYDLNFNYINEIRHGPMYDDKRGDIPVSFVIDELSNTDKTVRGYILTSNGRIFEYDPITNIIGTPVSLFETYLPYEIYVFEENRTPPTLAQQKLYQPEGSNFKKIVNCKSSKDILYVATNRNIYKLYKTSLDTPITVLDFDTSTITHTTSWNVPINITTDFRDISAQTIESFDTVLHDGYDYMAVTTTTLSSIMREDTHTAGAPVSGYKTSTYLFKDKNITTKLYNQSFYTNYFTLSDIYVLPQEIVNNITFNKTTKKLIYNHYSFLESLNKKIYTYFIKANLGTSVVPAICTVNDHGFEKLSTFDNNDEFYIGMNEPLLTDVVNRPIELLYKQQETLFDFIKESQLNTDPPLAVSTRLPSKGELATSVVSLDESSITVSSGGVVSIGISRRNFISVDNNACTIQFYTLKGSADEYSFEYIDPSTPSIARFEKGITNLTIEIGTAKFFAKDDYGRLVDKQTYDKNPGKYNKTFTFKIKEGENCIIDTTDIHSIDECAVKIEPDFTKYNITLFGDNSFTNRTGTGTDASAGNNYVARVGVQRTIENGTAEDYTLSAACNIRTNINDKWPIDMDYKPAIPDVDDKYSIYSVDRITGHRDVDADFPSVVGGTDAYQVSAAQLPNTSTIFFQPGVSSIVFDLSAENIDFDKNIESGARVDVQIWNPTFNAVIDKETVDTRDQEVKAHQTKSVTLIEQYKTINLFVSSISAMHRVDSHNATNQTLLSCINIWEALSASNASDHAGSNTFSDVSANYPISACFTIDQATAADALSVISTDDTLPALYFKPTNNLTFKYYNNQIDIVIKNSTNSIVGKGGKGGNGLAVENVQAGDGGTRFDNEDDRVYIGAWDDETLTTWAGTSGGPALSGFDNHFKQKILITNNGKVYGGAGGGGGGLPGVSAAEMPVYAWPLWFGCGGGGGAGIHTSNVGPGGSAAVNSVSTQASDGDRSRAFVQDGAAGPIAEPGTGAGGAGGTWDTSGKYYPKIELRKKELATGDTTEVAGISSNVTFFRAMTGNPGGHLGEPGKGDGASANYYTLDSALSLPLKDSNSEVTTATDISYNNVLSNYKLRVGGAAGNIITSTVTPVTAGTGEFHGTGDY